MDSQLRIAVFIDAMGWGGAEKSLLAQLCNLDYSRVSVDLYTISAGFVTHEVSALLPGDVRCRYLPLRRCKLWVRACKIGYSLMIRLLPRLGIQRHFAELYWRSMKSAFPRLPDDYNVAISYQQGIMTYYVAEKVKANRKIAWINSQLSGHGHRVSFSRKYYDKYDHVVAVCDQLNFMLRKSGYVDPARLITIYDIIDEDDVRRKSHDICNVDSSHDWVFVTVARLAPEKNLNLVVEAARILKEKDLDFVWYIVGGGDEFYSLRMRISQLGLDEQVILAGPQDNPFKYMNAADVYVQTSRNEGFGMTIAEARILNKPVVSTDFPMVYDQIKDGFNGLIAKMTPESVAGKIMTLVTDESLRHSIIKNLSEERNLTAITEPRKFHNLIFRGSID